jgi:hypothetical protein
LSFYKLYTILLLLPTIQRAQYGAKPEPASQRY